MEGDHGFVSKLDDGNWKLSFSGARKNWEGNLLDLGDFPLLHRFDRCRCGRNPQTNIIIRKNNEAMKMNSFKPFHGTIGFQKQGNTTRSSSHLDSATHLQ